jgi:hypothetical protein
MRDATNGKQLKRVLSPASVSDNTAQVGQIIDHQGYDAATYLILTGSIADADVTFTVLLEESNASDLSGGNAVDDADMISQTSGTAPETAAAFRFDDDNEVRKLGYIGKKRYTRLTITPANNASAAVLAACCVLERATIEPVTQGAA